MYILLLLRYMYAYIYILPDNVEEMCRVFLLQSKKVEVAAILLPFGAKETTGSIRGLLLVELQDLLPVHTAINHHLSVAVEERGEEDVGKMGRGVKEEK